MRPLIPRVKVGDVLKGTRNLRYYLQTASTLNYLNEVRDNMGSVKRAKSHLYRPSKEDEFLVTVNAWGMFGVCSLKTDVCLLFANPSDPSPVSDWTAKPMTPVRRVHGIRMDPTIFSQWFIRTAVKMTDLRDWQDHAFYMRASLHLNMNSCRADGAPTFYFQNHHQAPFTMHTNGTPWKREQLIQFMQDWITRGTTRATAPSSRNLPSAGFGPRLEEISDMRREIKEMCSNPRIARRLKSEANNVYEAFIQNQ